jgi:hypothetical protein
MILDNNARLHGSLSTRETLRNEASPVNVFADSSHTRWSIDRGEVDGLIVRVAGNLDRFYRRAGK